MARQDISNHYDLIVIGSGMSGMAAASIVAQMRKWRVLVLESHITLGGYTHAFKRNGYEWDPGFHYVGDMTKGTQTRDCMDFVTGGQVEWQKLNEGFEQLVFPDQTLELPSSPKAHKALLQKEFPEERDGIEQYFTDIYKIRNWSSLWYASKLFPDWIGNLLTGGPKRQLAEMLTQDYLDQRFKDPLLKAVLTSQWGDYGTPPGRSAFGVHAIVAADFMNGGYYAIGGAQKIADSAKSIVERFGGRCMPQHKVTEILISKNKAHGVAVETKGGTQFFYAPHILSAAGIDTTFNKLVPEPYGKRERERLKHHTRGISATILFMGLNDDPRNHGYKDTNYWMFDKLDHRYEEEKEFPPLIGNTTLSFASLRNPTLKKHVAQLVTFSAYKDWEDHQDSAWLNRGEEYLSKKDLYIETLLDFVEERFPRLRNLIEYRELATPLTFESITGHVNGQVYGRECTPDRIKENWNVHTSVHNLYLTGIDLCVPGINSALMIGVMSASRFVNPRPFGLLRIFKRAASNNIDLASLFRAE